MQANLNSARLAPKKANLMAKMVRGLPVPVAMELLRKTHKKSARLFEHVLRSAIANAEHNFKQDAQTMILKEVIVNQGTHYKRGTPMARGRVRPLKKFLCHISISLGYESDVKNAPKKEKKVQETASQTEKKTVKTGTAPKAAAKKSSTSSSK
jgi:large subunit ribosomal protein L22